MFTPDQALRLECLELALTLRSLAFDVDGRDVDPVTTADRFYGYVTQTSSVPATQSALLKAAIALREEVWGDLHPSEMVTRYAVPLADFDAAIAAASKSAEVA